MAGADQSVGKSEKSCGTAAKALVDRSIAPINPMIMGLFLSLIRGTSYGEKSLPAARFQRTLAGFVSLPQLTASCLFGFGGVFAGSGEVFLQKGWDILI